MTRHLLIPVLINDSGKLSRIASRGNKATTLFNNLLKDVIKVVKINEEFVAIYRSDLQRLHSADPILNALMLKEIHHDRLMMLAFFSFQFFLKLAWHALVLSNT